MDFDKRNGNVVFRERDHAYFNINSPNIKYDSVTTVIGKFCHEFDKDFWSAYKALLKLLDPQDFAVEKKRLLETKKFDKKYFLEIYDISEVTFNLVQQEILDDWAKTNRQSCEYGTKVHSELELTYKKQKNYKFNKFGLGGVFQVHNWDEPLSDGIYPEYLIHVCKGNLRLAGQIDLLVIDGEDVYIADYKTVGHLDEKSYWDSKTKKNQMMKYPLNNMMDCNKVHYTLQLSTYAWMLLQNYPSLNIKKLILIHYDHSGGVTEYEVDYLKADVEKMCKYWSTQSLVEKKKELRKPIEF